MKPLVIIPARGGSKRIPRKNLSSLSGKPALGVLIEKLKRFELFDTLFVSTEDLEISRVAEEYGAKVINRSNPALSDDFTPSEDVVRDVLRQLNLEDSEVPVFCIYPLAVLVKEEYLRAALEKLLDHGDKFIISGSKLEPNPLRHTFVLHNEFIRVLHPENNAKRSQELESVFVDVGMFYLAKANVWSRKEIYWYCDNAIMVEVHERDAIDVDTPQDLNLLKSRFREEGY